MDDAAMEDVQTVAASGGKDETALSDLALLLLHREVSATSLTVKVCLQFYKFWLYSKCFHREHWVQEAVESQF